MNGRVQYNPIDCNYRVYWQGRLMRPTFSNRLAALRYLTDERRPVRHELLEAMVEALA